MIKWLFFSLRYKLMLALTAVPAIALFVFFQLATDIFETDKIAYVFDSLLAMSKSGATQVRNDLNHFKILAQTIALAVNLEKRELSESGRFLLESDRRVLGFSLYQVDQQNRAPEAIVDVHPIAPQTRLVTDLIGSSTREPDVGSAKFRILDADSALLLIRLGQAQEWPRTYVALRITRHDLATLFNHDGTQRIYLIENGQGVLFGGSGLSNSQALNAIRSHGFQDGTMEVNETGGRADLISVSSVGLGDLHVVSVVERATALSAINTLTRKALLFFLALVLTTFVISVIASQGLTRSLQRLLLGTKEIADGNFDIALEIHSKDEVGALASSFNTMAKEVSRLIEETKERARMESELETAQTVQRTLFPPAHVTLGPVQISGYYEPASECGGDWWYYFDGGDFVFVCIGDATGHGAPAALLTSAARAASSVIQTTSNLSPREFLSLLNSALYDTANGGMMMTFFAARIEKSTGLLTYANASHEAPALLKHDEKNPSKDSFVYLQDTNAPRLGDRRDIVVQEATAQLRPGDQLILFTDGVYDIQNPDGKEFGHRRFYKMLAEALEPRAATRLTLQTLVQGMHEWKLGTNLKDDVTLVVIHYQSPEASGLSNVS